MHITNIRQNLMIGTVAILLLMAGTNASSPSCDRSTPNSATSFVGKQLPYPFGCSAGCEIQLNCTEAGIFIGEFRIRNIYSDSIRVDFQSRCNRPLDKLRQLYSNHHAPTSHNAILLGNCTDYQVTSSCMIPSINVEARFQAPSDCKAINTSLSCYVESSKNATFLEYESMNKKGCMYFLSSISAEQVINRAEAPAVVLDVEVVDVGWWLPGVCNCAQHAVCVNVTKPDGTDGYRCNCTEGFVGDGFRDGFGCRKVTAGKSKLSSKTIGVIAGSITATLFLFATGYCLITKKAWKKYNTVKETNGDTDDIGGAESLQFDFTTIEAATNNFSDDNKLGEGGFGKVYKGLLANGQEIAIKRLSRNSSQGIQEFKNEMVLVAKLQHKNLVRLFGFCLEGEEKMLVYEYVPNKSLDYILFDPEKQGQLNWQRRYKIIAGISRGFLYLHEDSRLRIIHRDLKASNILLDGEMQPKVSDFGMARIFGIDQTQANTNRIVGTYGYMSPEYAMHGEFSVKSDIYSFGVLVLEIISGKKNSYYFQTDPDAAARLVSHAWKLWRDGRPLELLDPCLSDSFSINEVIRCINIGLLCVQEDPGDRPTMQAVVLMLNNYHVALPFPQEPVFFNKTRSEFIRQILLEADRSNGNLNQSGPITDLSAR